MNANADRLRFYNSRYCSIRVQKEGSGSSPDPSKGVFYEKVLPALVLFYVLIISSTPSQNCHTKKDPKHKNSASTL